MYLGREKSRMLDGDTNTYWNSNRENGAWFEIDSPKSQLFKSLIITKRPNDQQHYNVCLFVDNESVPEVCTEDRYGNPLLSGEEITFSIEPRPVNKELTLIFFTCRT